MDIQHLNRACLAIAEKHDIETSDALNQMKNSNIWLIADISILNSYSTQLAFITALNISKRVFLGSVFCILPADTPNLLKFTANSLNSLVIEFGGKIINGSPTGHEIKILFGIECFDNYCIESISSGWRGGINFYDQPRITLPGKESKISLGPVASASLACFYAFCKIFKLIDNEIDINTGISLWNINSGNQWYYDENDGPTFLNMPRNLWILGLGHLGQAYLWTLGLMPFKNPENTTFLIQDADIVNIENLGSQVLSNEQNIGFPKTRACCSFLESLKFKTQIIEKPFIKGDSEQKWMENYPLLLNGVDNVETRKSILGRSQYLDGATNGTLPLFDSFTMKNVTQISKDIDDIWPENEIDNNDILHKNLYQRYEKTMGCGVITNIGISTPFVGLFSSTLIISELLRSLNKGRKYSVISLQLRDLSNMEAIEIAFYDKALLRYAI